MGRNSGKGHNPGGNNTCQFFWLFFFFSGGIHIWNFNTLACTVQKLCYASKSVTDAAIHRRTHEHPRSNMLLQLLQSWRIKKKKYVYVHRYPNWYTTLKSCRFMYITDWIPVCILSARARVTAMYIIYVRSMYIVQSCFSSLLCIQNMPLFDWIWIFYFPAALDGTLKNKMTLVFLCIHEKGKIFCLESAQVRRHVFSYLWNVFLSIYNHLICLDI